MQLWSRQNLSGAGVLVACLMLANFLNFAFNAFLGRQLSYEQFGLLTFYSTIVYLVGILFAAYGSTINHRTAYLNGKYGHEAGWMFARNARRNATWGMVGLTALWLAFSPVLAGIFQISDMASVVLFSPVFILGMVVGINKGFLQGNLSFMNVAMIVLVEPFIKLSAAGFLVWWGRQELVYLAIPLSLLASFAMSIFLVSNKAIPVDGDNKFRFPKRFLAAAVVTGLSTTAFLSLDVVLVKHFMDPESAGHYSLLSLVGKMVFFLGTLLNGFMITFVSHDVGEKKNSMKTFYRLFGAACALVVAGVVALGVFGQYTVPLLLGDKVLPILPYLLRYSISIGFFTLSAVMVVYHLAREQYSFSVVALFLTLLMGLGLAWQHDSIAAVVHVIFWSSLGSMLVVSFMHSVHHNSQFFLANLVDLVGVFRPLPHLQPLKTGGKRILIFNWRDMRHVFAGGAEVYIHEMAKRWVRDGNQVTVFCGNDGRSPHNETIDGVRVVRRGGFYFVYFWAFVYYLTRFRGRFDVLLDCQNGIPFFAPLYAKEKVYSLLFHVHQKVFFKYLPKPLAWFASVLENRAMPYVYRKTKFITISESSKRDMLKLGLMGVGIDVIFPGVDLTKLMPGQKDSVPNVLYLGRLKAYKSVDVLIRSFKEVVKRVGDAKLVIAGKGEEEASLKLLVSELGLEGNVEFMGKVTEMQKVGLMQRAWVFVNPSLTEGWGITTIEANACGTPVVASDVPGLRDSVNDPDTGFLVPHGNAGKLAEQIIRLLDDQPLRSKMSKSTLEWAKQFNWDISSRKGLELFYA